MQDKNKIIVIVGPNASGKSRLGVNIAKKIREAEIQRVPYILVIGEKEMKDNKVAVRERSKGDLGAMHLEEFLKKAL